MEAAAPQAGVLVGFVQNRAFMAVQRLMDGVPSFLGVYGKFSHQVQSASGLCPSSPVTLTVKRNGEKWFDLVWGWVGEWEDAHGRLVGEEVPFESRP